MKDSINISKEKIRDLPKDREIDTGYWLKDCDIEIIMNILVEKKFGGFNQDHKYFLNQKFLIDSKNPDKLGIVAILPPTDGREITEDIIKQAASGYANSKRIRREKPDASLSKEDYSDLLEPKNIKELKKFNNNKGVILQNFSEAEWERFLKREKGDLEILREDFQNLKKPENQKFLIEFNKVNLSVEYNNEGKKIKGTELQEYTDEQFEKFLERQLPAVDESDVSTNLETFFTGERNVLDKIINNLEENTNLRILSPHNISGNHWGCSEINIAKQGENFKIECSFHNPYGGGELNTHYRSDLQNALKESIKRHCPCANVKIDFVQSPYKKRQVDGSSCGVHTIVDLLDRIEGKKLNQKLVYGAKAKRQEFIELVQKSKSHLAEEFIKRNTKPKRFNNSAYTPNIVEVTSHESKKESKPTSSSASTSKPLDNTSQQKNEITTDQNNARKFTALILLYTVGLLPTIISWITHIMSKNLFKQIEYEQKDTKSSNNSSYSEYSTNHVKNLKTNQTARTR